MSVATTMRAMARTPDGRAALVELKAIDNSYPLYGGLALEPQQPLPEVLAERDGVFGAAADPALLARLVLSPGARVSLGSAAFEIVPCSSPSRTSLAVALGSDRACS